MLVIGVEQMLVISGDLEAMLGHTVCSDRSCKVGGTQRHRAVESALQVIVEAAQMVAGRIAEVRCILCAYQVFQFSACSTESVLLKEPEVVAVWPQCSHPGAGV